MNYEDITIQEMKFCNGILNGLTQRESYKQAWPDRAASWKIESIDTEASLLLRIPKISRVLAYKKEELEKQMFMSTEYKRAELRAIWEDINNPLKDRLKAMELDAKLASQLNQKIELAGNLGLTHSVAPEISDALDNLFGK